MNGVGKVLPHNNKVILKDIYLSFFYGAKIGIIGLNGSGKSTLLKIIAGVEKSYKGEVVWAPGYSVGYLEQEPQMDPEKTVIEVVKEGVQEVVDMLEEYNERAALGRTDGRIDRKAGRIDGKDRALPGLGDRIQARKGHGCTSVSAIGCAD